MRKLLAEQVLAAHTLRLAVVEASCQRPLQRETR
jgi:hypothetical protein